MTKEFVAGKFLQAENARANLDATYSKLVKLAIEIAYSFEGGKIPTNYILDEFRKAKYNFDDAVVVAGDSAHYYQCAIEGFYNREGGVK